jgi:hypothetical protein
MRKSLYPASCVERGADGAVVERDDLANVVDVGVGAVREHGPAAGEPELVAVDADPVLHRLLDGELPVRHVGEPGDVAAPRPRKRAAVPGRRRNEAPQELLGHGAVPLPVHQPVPRVPQRSRHVHARRVLRVLGRARAEPLRRLRRGGGGRVERGRVVRGEVAGVGVGVGAGGGGSRWGGRGGGAGDGAGGGYEAAVLPDANEVAGGAGQPTEGTWGAERAPPRTGGCVAAPRTPMATALALLLLLCSAAAPNRSVGGTAAQ